MDTREARRLVEEIAGEALALIESWGAGRRAKPTDRHRLQELLGETRELLVDAGYPAEPVWRALHRAVIGVDTAAEQENPGFWLDLAADLRQARETLGVLGYGNLRDADVNVVS